MQLSIIDAIAFLAFIAAVVGISLYASRKEDHSEDYFLAGRRLSWWLIGFSLIASNISTEHFVGMAGAGFGVAGLAIASYEWVAAITLVLVGHILPAGLRGVFFAALFGAVMSSLDSMLNSASTIFTMDIYHRHFKSNASPKALVKIGRIATAVLVVAGCLIGPMPAKFEGVFQYIQLVWGFISPGIVIDGGFELY